jgi:4-hydroxy-3-methylbut-2-enyl diphosphate reductase
MCRRIQLVESVADVARLSVASADALAYVTQTTLSVDDAAAIVAALKERYPRIVGPKKDDICYATQNRQDAVKFMARQADVVIVVGSPNSSNSNRLREVAVKRTLLHDRPGGQLRPEWLIGKAAVGVTAGASAPGARASPGADSPGLVRASGADGSPNAREPRQGL